MTEELMTVEPPQEKGNVTATAAPAVIEASADAAKGSLNSQKFKIRKASQRFCLLLGPYLEKSRHQGWLVSWKKREDNFRA